VTERADEGDAGSGGAGTMKRQGSSGAGH